MRSVAQIASSNQTSASPGGTIFRTAEISIAQPVFAQLDQKKQKTNRDIRCLKNIASAVN